MIGLTPGEIFTIAVDFVLGPSIEGGLVDDPRDPGGITNRGISLRFALGAAPLDLDHDGRPDLDIDGNGTVDRADILAMTAEKARHILELHFWKPLGCEIMPPTLAVAVFDAGVNQGRGAAVTDMQRAFRIPDDGKLGPQTRRYAAAATREQVQAFIALRAARYVQAQSYPTHGLGWLRRLAACAWLCGSLDDPAT